MLAKLYLCRYVAVNLSSTVFDRSDQPIERLSSHKPGNLFVNKFTHTGLILALTIIVGAAYSPAVMADKKDHSNSNSDDDNNNNKDKKKDDDQNNKSQKNTGSQQFQKFQQNNQFKSSKSDNSQQKFQSNNQFQIVPQGQDGSKQLQLQNSSKQPNWQNFQKQNNSSQNLQKQNIQLQGVQNKPDWIKQDHHDHKDVKNFVVKFGGPEPFSSKWYKDHPSAWHYHHDHDDAWKVITAASVVGFLGWEAYHPRGPVVVYQPVPYDTLFVSRPGVIIDPSRGEWMPLGQYTLMLGPGDDSTRMLDLAIDRFGHIRGSYYDMVSGVAHDVAGIVNPRSQYAQWSLESNRQLTFYTPMGEMMQPQGLVYVQLPSGERQQWQLVRMDGQS